MALQYPLKNYTVSQGFGSNAAYYKQFGQKGHNGLDLAAKAGEPLYAADNGVIAFEGWGQNHSWMGGIAGISVIIKHASIHTAYAHLTRTVVNKGQVVKKGQLIGYVGATGTATGPHTHFEVLPLSPNFSNGYAGRINPMPFLSTVRNATAAEVKKAYLEILEREADAEGIRHYTQYPLDFVRKDLAASAEKRRLDAKKAAAAKAAADAAKKAAELEATAKAKAKAEADRLAAEAEQARIEEEERLAREAAKARAQAQQEIQEQATPEGGDMATTPTKEAVDKVNPVEPVTVKTPTEATKSATQFVLRIGSQIAAARIIAEGVAAVVYQQIAYTITDFWVGVVTLTLAALLIFWSQFGYQMAKNANWKWAANLKWPF